MDRLLKCWRWGKDLNRSLWERNRVDRPPEQGKLDYILVTPKVMVASIEIRVIS